MISCWFRTWQRVEVIDEEQQLVLLPHVRNRRQRIEIQCCARRLSWRSEELGEITQYGMRCDLARLLWSDSSAKQHGTDNSTATTWQRIKQRFSCRNKYIQLGKGDGATLKVGRYVEATRALHQNSGNGTALAGINCEYASQGCHCHAPTTQHNS